MDNGKENGNYYALYLGLKAWDIGFRVWGFRD